jgi:hypothetical protein
MLLRQIVLCEISHLRDTVSTLPQDSFSMPFSSPQCEQKNMEVAIFSNVFLASTKT